MRTHWHGCPTRVMGTHEMQHVWRNEGSYDTNAVRRKAHDARTYVNGHFATTCD